MSLWNAKGTLHKYYLSWRAPFWTVIKVVMFSVAGQVEKYDRAHSIAITNNNTGHFIFFSVSHGIPTVTFKIIATLSTLGLTI